MRERMEKRAVSVLDERLVVAGPGRGDCFDGIASTIQHVASLLSTLRHVTALHLILSRLVRPTSPHTHAARPACLSAATLHTAPIAGGGGLADGSVQITGGSSHIHAGAAQPRAARLRLGRQRRADRGATPAVQHAARPSHHTKRPSAADGTFAGWFPSLVHLAVGCCRLVYVLASLQPPPLSSFTVRDVEGVTDVDCIHITHVSTRSLRLDRSDNSGSRHSRRYTVQEVLARAPHLHQLSIADDVGTHQYIGSLSDMMPTPFDFPVPTSTPHRCATSSTSTSSSALHWLPGRTYSLPPSRPSLPIDSLISR